MQKIRSFIPDLFTLANLLCGCIALVFVLRWNYPDVAAYLILLAALFDFLDGFVARALGVSSELGKQLDSLADLVSFGVVPGMILFHLIHLSSIINSGKIGVSLEIHQTVLPWAGMLVPLFSAYRLAKFNIDKRQSDSFIGLPTPANAIFIASFPLIIRNDWQDPPATSDELFLHPWFLLTVCLVMSLLLVSELKLIALKFRSFSLAENKFRYLLIISAIILLIIFQFKAIPFILLLYIVLSLINTLFTKNEIQS